MTALQVLEFLSQHLVKVSASAFPRKFLPKYQLFTILLTFASQGMLLRKLNWIYLLLLCNC